MIELKKRDEISEKSHRGSSPDSDANHFNSNTYIYDHNGNFVKYNPNFVSGFSDLNMSSFQNPIFSLNGKPIILSSMMHNDNGNPQLKNDGNSFNINQSEFQNFQENIEFNSATNNQENLFPVFNYPKNQHSPHKRRYYNISSINKLSNNDDNFPEMYKRTELTQLMQDEIMDEDKENVQEHTEYFEPYHFWAPDFE